MDVKLIVILVCFFTTISLTLGEGSGRSTESYSASSLTTGDTPPDRETCKAKFSGVCTINAGYEGLKGLKGERGERGPEGPPGSCRRCHSPIPTTTPTPEVTRGGDDTGVPALPDPDAGLTPDMPYPSCELEDGNQREGFFYINEEDSFEVYCNKKDRRTCLMVNADEAPKKESFIKHHSKPFWLSEDKAFDLKEFYGVTLQQLEWLQKRFSNVVQRIRYHCKNSQVSSPDDQKALHLLSWKDGLIGPRPNSYSPFHYTIEEDGCKDVTSTEANYTNILLESGHDRLPVLDFHIRDIRGGDQELYVEHRELCFY